MAGIPPIPGRVGTIRSPDTRQAPPEFLGAISETPTSITETYRAPARFTPVSNAELASPPDGRLAALARFSRVEWVQPVVADQYGERSPAAACVGLGVARWTQ